MDWRIEHCKCLHKLWLKDISFKYGCLIKDIKIKKLKLSMKIAVFEADCWEVKFDS